MKTYKLETRLRLAASRARVFKFFADPCNLERITPSWLRFEILTPPDTVIRQGTLLDYRLSLHGIPLHWQSEISLWEPPDRFVDRQTVGPYSLWVHEHTFTDDRGGTLIGDRVEYAVPGGRLVQKYLVVRDLEKIFAHRHWILESLFGANQAHRVSPEG